MKTGNSVPAAHDRHGARMRVRDDSQRQLRDIEELVAKLQVVTKQLETTGYDEARRSERADGDMN